MSSNKELVDGTVPSNKELVEGTVPSNKELVDGTVPSNKVLVDRTVPSNSTILLNIDDFQNKNKIIGDLIWSFEFVAVKPD